MGECRHIVAAEAQGSAAGLAICQYDGETAYYLFGCHPEWNTVTDTRHETLEEALERAELEYAGVSSTWHVVSQADAAAGLRSPVIGKPLVGHGGNDSRV